MLLTNEDQMIIMTGLKTLVASKVLDLDDDKILAAQDLLKGNLTDEKIFTIADISKSLKVHRTTVYSWIQDGRLKSITLGEGSRCLRVKESDLAAFMENSEA